MARVGRNEPCPCGSGKKFKRCCIDKPEEPEATGTGRPASGLTLFIETPNGVLIRNVLDASPLGREVDQGTAAEQATHDAAAVWGLPDFVYRGGLRRVGSGSRELGDGIVVVGSAGVVVQVKSRESPTADEAKEERWIRKQAKRAISQAGGSIRQLSHGSEQLKSARGQEVEIDGGSLNWTKVIVIDHPQPPGAIQIDSLVGFADDTVVLLRRDWEFVFEHLRSTRAVVSYFERVAGQPLELGDEPVRYFDLAAADRDAEPNPPDPALPLEGGFRGSSPLLPMESVYDLDGPAHLLIRSIFEDIAVSGIRQAPSAQRLQTLAGLDALPVGQRGMVGRFLIENFERVRAETGGIAWRFRRILFRPTPDTLLQLGFGVSNELTELHQDLLGSWVQLRHHDLGESSGMADVLTTVAILLTPRHDGQRQWDTTSVTATGALNLSEDELRQFREFWEAVAIPYD